jgi:hypothetical protein
MDRVVLCTALLLFAAALAWGLTTRREANFELWWTRAVAPHGDLVVPIDGDWRRVTEAQMAAWLRTLPVLSDTESWSTP